MRICFTWDDGALEDQKLFELHQKYEHFDEHHEDTWDWDEEHD